MFDLNKLNDILKGVDKAQEVISTVVPVVAEAVTGHAHAMASHTPAMESNSEALRAFVSASKAEIDATQDLIIALNKNTTANTELAMAINSWLAKAAG